VHIYRPSRACYLPLEVSHEYTAYGTAANNSLNKTNIVSLGGDDNTPTVLSVTQYTNVTKAFFTFKTSPGSTVQAYCDVDARKKSTTSFVKNSDVEFYETPTDDFADVRMSRTDGWTGSLPRKKGLRRTSTMRRHQLPSRNPCSQLLTAWTAYQSQDPSCTA